MRLTHVSCRVWIVVLAMLYPTWAQTTIAPTTNVTAPTPIPTDVTQPPPVSASSVNPLVVGFGVVVLLVLFGTSFYIVVMWPRRSLLNYRRKFEDMVNRDRARGDEKEFSKARGTATVYGGAAIEGEEEDKGPKKIPTFRQIERAQKQRQEELDQAKAMSDYQALDI